MSAAKYSDSLPPVEAVAEQLHNAHVIANKNAAVFTEKAPSGEETMVPYDQLSDGVKLSIQDRVRVIYAAIDAAAERGSTKTRKAG